jgi:hypothetical protein
MEIGSRNAGVGNYNSTYKYLMGVSFPPDGAVNGGEFFIDAEGVGNNYNTFTNKNLLKIKKTDGYDALHFQGDIYARNASFAGNGAGTVKIGDVTTKIAELQVYGKVGIGLATNVSPSCALDVSGNITTTGTGKFIGDGSKLTNIVKLIKIINLANVAADDNYNIMRRTIHTFTLPSDSTHYLVKYEVFIGRAVFSSGSAIIEVSLINVLNSSQYGQSAKLSVYSYDIAANSCGIAHLPKGGTYNISLIGNTIGNISNLWTYVSVYIYILPVGDAP